MSDDGFIFELEPFDNQAQRGLSGTVGVYGRCGSSTRLTTAWPFSGPEGSSSPSGVGAPEWSTLRARTARSTVRPWTVTHGRTGAMSGGDRLTSRSAVSRRPRSGSRTRCVGRSG